jgi:hypothetical protein
MACRFPALFTVSPLPPNVLRGARDSESVNHQDRVIPCALP